MFLFDIFSSQKIVWHFQKEFWLKFDSQYRQNNKYLERLGYFELPLDILTKLADSKSVATPAEEEDFAGPCERWYCETQGHLFLITYYHSDQNYVVLAMEDSAVAIKSVRRALSKKGIEFETYET